jgi:hypothetical protein
LIAFQLGRTFTYRDVSHLPAYLSGGGIMRGVIRFEAWLSCLIAGLIGFSVAEAGEGQADERKVPAILLVKPVEEDPNDDELRKLIRARYNTAVLEVQHARQLFLGGRVTFDNVASAGQRLVQAGLEYHRSPAERGELLSQYVELTREYERAIESKVNNGVEGHQVLYQARFERLNAEIQLLRFKQTAEPGSPPAGRNPFGTPKK